MNMADPAILLRFVLIILLCSRFAVTKITPLDVVIRDHNVRQNMSNATLNVTSGMTYYFICIVPLAPPKPLLHWEIPDGVQSTVYKQHTYHSNDGQGNRSRYSRVMYVTPARNISLIKLFCVVDHPMLDDNLSAWVLLNVQNSEHRTSTPLTPFITSTENLREGVASIITCTVSSDLAPAFEWFIGNRKVTKNLSTSVNVSNATQSSGGNNFTTVLQLMPSRSDNRLTLVCQAEINGAAQNATKILSIHYRPLIKRSEVFHKYSTESIQNVTMMCVCDGNPPAHTFAWFKEEWNITKNVSKFIFDEDIEFNETLSSGSLTVIDFQQVDSGMYECKAESSIGVAMRSFNVTSCHDSYTIHIHESQTTSSSVFVIWRPVIRDVPEGRLGIEFCTNDTTGGSDCKLQWVIRGRNLTLIDLQPFRWYSLVMRERSTFSSCSGKPVFTSTAPLSPKDYGIEIMFSNTNGSFSLTTENATIPHNICFVLKTSDGVVNNCSLLTGEEYCINPGSSFEVEQDVDQIEIITYGRGLCSKPSVFYINSYETDQNTPYSFLRRNLAAIAGGAIGTLVMMALAVLILVHLRKRTARNKQFKSVTTSNSHGQFSSGERDSVRYNGRRVDDDGLIYIDVSLGHAQPPSSNPTQSADPTIYAALDKDAMKHLKNLREKTGSVYDEHKKDSEIYENYEVEESVKEPCARTFSGWNEKRTEGALVQQWVLWKSSDECLSENKAKQMRRNLVAPASIYDDTILPSTKQPVYGNDEMQSGNFSRQTSLK